MEDLIRISILAETIAKCLTSIFLNAKNEKNHWYNQDWFIGYILATSFQATVGRNCWM